MNLGNNPNRREQGPFANDIPRGCVNSKLIVLFLLNRAAEIHIHAE